MKNGKKKGTRPSATGNKTQKILNKAIALHNTRQFAEAGKIYREILATDPNNPDALHLSALLAIEDQNFDTAKKLIDKAIQNYPHAINFYIAQGCANEGLKDYATATAAYQKALQLDNKSVDANFFLAKLNRTLGQTTKAIEFYNQALTLNPKHLASQVNLANIYTELGDFESAMIWYQKAAQNNPDSPELYLNMGNAYKDMRQAQEAVECYEKAIALRPNAPEPYNNIGYILQQIGKLHDAITYLEKALAIRPDLPEVFHNLGNVYKDMGKFDKAIAAYRNAVRLRPDFTNAHSNILFAMNYDEHAHPAEMYAEAKKWWQQQAAHLAGQFKPANTPDPNRKLRIGYVSPDFCMHSVSFFFLSLLEKHDRRQFEIFCYSDAKIQDDMTRRLQSLSDHWRHISGQTDEIVAQLIYEDKIDIVFDLTGHTAYNRLLAFARGPAPVQLAWLGYPNTTGVETIQYRITDDIADPPETSDPFYTEKLIRLPHCFLCYSPPETAPAIGELPTTKQGKVTFGSFNNITKTSESVIKAWCEILTRVDNSQIMLKSIVFADPASQKHYLDIFGKYGIGPERIILKKRTASTEEHLNLYNEVDIGLDPFPYNGTTTTCEALWMGVPVIALRGDRHCARVSASILTHAGLEQFVANTPDEYIDKAVDLANNKKKLAEFRKNARPILSDSVLLNKELFAGEMESTLRKAWIDWCASATGTLHPESKKERDKMNQHNADELNQKGEEFFEAGNYSEAATLFRQAIEQDPSHATAYNNLGVLNYHLGQHEEALQCFRKTMEINPADQTALENIGELLKAMHTASPIPEQPNPQEEAQEEDIVTTMNSFPFWYHKIELPGDIVTPGYAPISAEAYRVPMDLTGKRVLDVGAWDGYWSFEALKRGAKEVVAIDDFSDYLGSLEERDRKAWETFDFCKRQLGYSDDRCKRMELSVYEATEERLGKFDVVFFFGTLYHLRYPLLALDKLSALCEGEIFVETAILDDFSPYNGGFQKGYAGRQMVMEFYPGKEYGGNETNWWAPTLYCLINMLKAAGFNNCRGWKLTDSPQELPHCRGFAYGNKLAEEQA